MYDDRAAPYVQLVPEADRFKSFHLVKPGADTYSTGPAVIATLKSLDRTQSVGRSLEALRLTWFVSAFYWVTAHSRGFLGRFVRDDEGPTRFGD